MPSRRSIGRRTSKKVARTASAILRDKRSSPKTRSVAGSALSQRVPRSRK